MLAKSYIHFRLSIILTKQISMIKQVYYIIFSFNENKMSEVLNLPIPTLN